MLKVNWYFEWEAELWIREEEVVSTYHRVDSWTKDAMQQAPATYRPCPGSTDSLERRGIDICLLSNLGKYLCTAKTVETDSEILR